MDTRMEATRLITQDLRLRVQGPWIICCWGQGIFEGMENNMSYSLNS